MYGSKVSPVGQYIRKLSGQEKEPQNVDHNYMKHWTCHSDSNRVKPVKMLFMKTLPRYCQNQKDINEEDIDVVTTDVPLLSPFDTPKSKAAINDIEQSLKLNSNIPDSDESEIEIVLKHSTYRQKRIYDGVIRILESYMLEKAVYSGDPLETRKKRISTEKHALELRIVFATSFYDFELIFWIHKIILELSNFDTVVSYINLLQALHAKVPSVVEKIVKSSSGRVGEEYLFQIVKKQWDPIPSVVNQYKSKRLPRNPFLLISCAGIDFGKAEESPRFNFFRSALGTLCKTVYIPVVSDDGSKIINAEKMADIAVTAMKLKVQEIKNHFPNRPIIVAGWTIGAVIACHVALEKPVDACICFGFPLTGVNGSRGDLDDPLLNSTKPTLFIVGQNAHMCSIDDIEDFRFRMSGETGLVVIGGADDYLRISPKKMIEENITQSIVDRCILDEIGEFLQSALVKLPSTSSSLSNSTLMTCPTIMEETEEESAESEHEKNYKKGRHKDFTPELSNKRFRPSILKQTQHISAKSQLSTSSSEASSSGSSKGENPTFFKAGKRKPVKRAVGRPAGNKSRKKITVKSHIKPALKQIVKPIPKAVIKLSKKTTEQKAGENSISNALNINTAPPLIDLLSLESSPIKPTKPKTPISFALNILPQKNVPVDVEKAFGKDSSFLPRPLTPEPEDITPVGETDDTVQAGQDILECDNTIPVSESVKVQNDGSRQFKTLPISEKSIITFTEQAAIPCSNSKSTSVSAIKKVVIPASKRITVPVATSTYKTVFQQSKVLNPSAIAQFKNLAGMNLISNPANQANIANTSKTMITIPSNSAILLNGSTLKGAQSGKVLKLLSKASIKRKDPKTSLFSRSGSTVINKSSSPVVCESGSSIPSGSLKVGESVSSITNGCTDSQVCNLSLLSDVAGMKEPLKDMRKSESISSPAATLVKLAVQEKSSTPKQFHVLKTVPNYSAVPTFSRVDTPEEMVEKQLAIQALNRSIGVENSIQPVKESGYSICFAKPDGSILSRTVPKTSNTTYIRPSLLPQISARGKIPSVLHQINFHKK